MSDLSFLRDLGTLKSELKPQPGTAVYDTLTAFVTQKISEAKRRLRDEGRSSSGALEASIAPTITEDQGKVIVQILAEDYYDFINKGVDGLERKFGSPYSFKTLGVGRQMLTSFEDFIRNRGIKQLTYTSREGEQIQKVLETANDYKSAAYVLARATKKKGIEPTFFMDKTFDKKSLDELAETLGKTVTQIFN